MEKLDKIDRRFRWEPTTSGTKVFTTDRDVMWFEKIHNHGPLSSVYLAEFTRLLYGMTEQGANRKTKDRLTALYHEDETFHDKDGKSYYLHGTLLSCPEDQWATRKVEHNARIYDLTARSERVLKDEGIWSDRAQKAGGTFVHRYMTACITASIELATIKAGNVRYIPQSEILDRSQCNLTFPIVVRGTSHNLCPDAIFGLEYDLGDRKGYRFFIVEADRFHEPVRTANFDTRKSYERTILQYKKFIAGKQYKDDLKMTASLQVLTVTRGPNAQNTLVRLTGELSDGSNNYLLYQNVPLYFNRWFSPPPVLYDLFENGWERAGTTPFFINNPQRQD